MPRQDQDPLAGVKRFGQFRNALDAHHLALAALGQEPERNEFPKQRQQVAVMRLGETHDLVFGNVAAIDTPEVFQDDATTVWKPSVNKPPPPCRGNDAWHLQCDRGGRSRRMAEGDPDGLDQMPPEDNLRGGARHDVRCAVCVAHDGKIHRRDDVERGLTRKKFQAGFLGCEARSEACRATRSVARIDDFLRRKQLAEVAGQRGDQPLDASDIDGIDRAALRK